jgi:transcriptional regulator with XRE-family HTH domain
MKRYPTIPERVVLAIPERRTELALSLNQLERISGVSRATISKIERGDHVDPAVLVRLGAALVVLDAYRPPRLDEDLVALAAIGQTALPGKEWAA